MMHEYYQGFQCPECEHLTLTRCGYYGDEKLPVVMWDSCECEEFQCEACNKKFYTTDFELLSEDDV